MSSPVDTHQDLLLAGDDRWLAGWEILSVLTSCLIAEWVISASAGKTSWSGGISILLAIGLMLLSHRERGESLRGVGFRVDNFLPAVRLLIIPTVLAVGLIAISMWLLAADRSLTVRPLRFRLLVVPIWALFQQYALQGFLNRRAQMLLGSGARSVILVALLFGLAHLPNPLFVALAILGGLVWAAVYQRRPNLFAVSISHAVASLALSFTVPASLSPTFRVGFKYFGLNL